MSLKRIGNVAVRLAVTRKRVFGRSLVSRKRLRVAVRNVFRLVWCPSYSSKYAFRAQCLQVLFQGAVHFVLHLLLQI